MDNQRVQSRHSLADEADQLLLSFDRSFNFYVVVHSRNIPLEVGKNQILGSVDSHQADDIDFRNTLRNNQQPSKIQIGHFINIQVTDHGKPSFIIG